MKVASVIYVNGISVICSGRDERIRTSDPSVPNAVLYQTEPRPDPGLCAAEYPPTKEKRTIARSFD